MSTRKNALPIGARSILLSAAVAAFAVPFAVHAAGADSPTREEVKKELAKSHQAGTHEMGGRVSTVKAPSTGSSASREQVKKELAKSHQAGTHDMGGMVSTAKQPTTGAKTSRQQVKKDLEKAHKEGTHDMGGEASPTKP